MARHNNPAVATFASRAFERTGGGYLEVYNDLQQQESRVAALDSTRRLFADVPDIREAVEEELAWASLLVAEDQAALGFLDA